MKHLIVLVIGLFALSTQAKINFVESNLKIEKGYLSVANELATSQNISGACGPIEAYTEEIVSATQKARIYFDNNWEYNKKVNRKFKISADTLKALKTTLALKDIMNMLDFNDPKSFETSLNRVIMWGPAPGAYGNMSYLEFQKDNLVKVANLELLDEKPYFKWNEQQGTFSVRKTGYEMIVSINVGNKVEEFILQKTYQTFYSEGMWQMTPLGSSPEEVWTKGYVDLPSECEA